MLKTDRAYRDACEALRILEAEALPAEEAKWRAKGASDATLAQLLGPMRAQAARLRADIERFDLVRQGDLTMFAQVEEVGELLIAARIARGLTQRQLAERLGVDESQVSRDERRAYENITKERLITICAALDLELHTYPQLRDITSDAVDLEADQAPSLADLRVAPPPPIPLPPASRAAAPQPTHRPAGWDAPRVPSGPYRPAPSAPIPATSPAAPDALAGIGMAGFAAGARPAMGSARAPATPYDVHSQAPWHSVAASLGHVHSEATLSPRHPRQSNQVDGPNDSGWVYEIRAGLRHVRVFLPGMRLGQGTTGGTTGIGGPTAPDGPFVRGSRFLHIAA